MIHQFQTVVSEIYKNIHDKWLVNISLRYNTHVDLRQSNKSTIPVQRSGSEWPKHESRMKIHIHKYQWLIHKCQEMYGFNISTFALTFSTLGGLSYSWFGLSRRRRGAGDHRRLVASVLWLHTTRNRTVRDLPLWRNFLLLDSFFVDGLRFGDSLVRPRRLALFIWFMVELAVWEMFCKLHWRPVFNRRRDRRCLF